MFQILEKDLNYQNGLWLKQLILQCNRTWPTLLRSAQTDHCHASSVFKKCYIKVYDKYAQFIQTSCFHVQNEIIAKYQGMYKRSLLHKNLMFNFETHGSNKMRCNFIVLFIYQMDLLIYVLTLY